MSKRTNRPNIAVIDYKDYYLLPKEMGNSILKTFKKVDEALKSKLDINSISTEKLLDLHHRYLTLTSNIQANVVNPIHIINNTLTPIWVRMDNREEYRIIGKGAQSFHPNWGDDPTFHVYTDNNGVKGNEIYSDSFWTVTCNNTIWWDGEELTEDDPNEK